MLTGDRALGPTFPLENIGWIDFEVRSPSTSIKDGTYRYAGHADAIIVAWAIGGSPVKTTAISRFGTLLNWPDMPDQFRAHHKRVERGEAIWAAWNAGFDKAIWNYSTLFPPLEPHHIIDVMAQATASGLPPDLLQASRVCGSSRKDPRGKNLIKLFCLPTSTATPDTHPKEWLEFQSYAGDDIKAMREVFLHTRQLPLAEWREYWAMERINERGVRIDRDMVKAAAELASQDKLKSNQEIFTITRGEVPTVDHVKVMTQWLLRNLPEEGRQILLKREEEVDENGEVTRPAKYHLTRSQIERLLAYIGKVKQEPDTEAEADALLNLIRAERILQIRLYGGSKTPAKFGKMLSQHVDGTLLGQYVFNGASQTGRASSKGVQIHNLARDTLEYEHEAIEAVLNECSYDELAELGDDAPVSRKLSLLIRPTFIPDEGNLFVWSDWSQIEARVLPWLAGGASGARNRLDVFRQVDADPSLPDLYTRTASVLSHVPIVEVTKAMRQRGKVAELALGFGGGLGSLQNMGAAYGLHIGEDEGRRTVARWRDANAWCVNFWDALWNAINDALAHPGAVQRAGRIHYVYLADYLGGSLLCLLPSGRCLTYRDIRREVVDELDDDDEVIGQSVQLRFARGYGRVKFWPGMAAENVVQAVAADVLRGTLVRLEDRGFRVRIQTHDEILVETEEADAEACREALRMQMQRGFEWSEGLPLMSAETISPYYTKVED